MHIFFTKFVKVLEISKNFSGYLLNKLRNMPCRDVGSRFLFERLLVAKMHFLSDFQWGKTRITPTR